MDLAFSYNFPAIKGVQAGKEYFVAMCPLHIIPKIFLFDEDEIPAKHRAQRIINKNRIPDITKYMVENHTDYVFSSLTASIDGETVFTPVSETEAYEDIGTLSISLDSKFLINDGQHRRAAIEEALKINPELRDETISVVFFLDEGLRKSQQMFADLNRHAVNTTTSIGILYDYRDQLSILTKDVVDEIPFLKRYTDRERVSLSKNSPKVLSLNHIYNANLKLLSKTKGNSVNDKEREFVIDFWSTLTNSITEWKQVMNKKLTPSELRVNFVIGHGILFESLGIVGNYLYEHHREHWKKFIIKLNEVDWSRENTELWDKRTMINGRIQKNNQTILLTSNQIKKQLELELTNKEERLETTFTKGASK